MTKHKRPFEAWPRPVKQVALSAAALRLFVIRYGGEYRRWLSLLAETRDFDCDSRSSWQRERLQTLLSKTIAGSPYFREIPEVHEAMNRGDLRDTLDALPYFNKQTLREHPHWVRNENVKPFSTTHTSGSTGAPVHIEHDAASVQRRFAFLTDHMRMAGVARRQPSIRLSGRVLFQAGEVHSRPWLWNPLENQVFLSSYHLNAQHADAFAGLVRSLRPVLLDGYPTAIRDLLRLMRAKQVDLTGLVAIISTAETLHDDLRSEITELSGLPVLDYYAASEGVPIIQQCRHGTYHVRWQSGIFEVVEGGRASLDGDGELVCTSFVQDRTPLIRYRTGDIVEGLSSHGQKCGCGMQTPTVLRVVGRVEDLVLTRGGGSLSMFTYRTLKQIDGLGETQIIQHDYDRFTVNSVIIAGADINRLRRHISTSFERVLGYPVELDLRPVDQLQKGPTGKIRLVISKMARPLASEPY